MRRIITALTAMVGLLLGTLVAIPASMAAPPDDVGAAATKEWTIQAKGTITLKRFGVTANIVGGFIDDDGTGQLQAKVGSDDATFTLSKIVVTSTTLAGSATYNGITFSTASGKPLTSDPGAYVYKGDMQGGLAYGTASVANLTLVTASTAGPLTFAPNPGNFGNAVVGGAPTKLTVKVTNSGAAATPSAITVTGAGVSDAGTGTCAVGTPIGESPGSCTVDLLWEPPAADNLLGSLEIAYPGGTSPSDTLQLTGKASATAQAGPLTFSSGAFPAANVGVASPLTVTVTNTGTAAAVPSAITATGTGVAKVAGGTCAVGTPIAVNGTCTQKLTWTPTAAGALKDADLIITYPNGAEPSDNLVLTGNSGGAPPSGDYTIAANGTVTVAGQTVPIVGGHIDRTGTGVLNVKFNGTVAQMKLSNISVDPTTLTGTATFGTYVFSTAPGAPLTSAAGAYKYSGDLVGAIGKAEVEDLTLLTSAQPGPLLFSSGKFPDATVGGSPVALTVTVSNSGGEPATPSAITVDGAGVANAGTGTCAVGTAIAAHPGSCTVDLTWTPTADGGLTGSLDIAYPGGTDANDTLLLTGEASEPGTAGPLSYSNGAFEPIEVGETDTLTVTVTNKGSANAVPSSIQATGPGVAKADGGTCAVGTAIAADASCTQKLTWTPTSAGPLENADLIIAYPNGVSASNNLVLTGEATSPSGGKTTLKVKAVKASKKLKVGKTTKVVKSAKTNAKIKKVKASCLLNGKTLSGKHKRAACSLKTKKTSSNAKVWAKAKCSTGLKVRVKIVANAKGMNKKTWSRTWKVKNDPRVSCTIHGNG